MPRAFRAVETASSMVLTPPSWAGSIGFVSPVDGDETGDTVTVEVDVGRGGEVVHYHLYVDGQFVRVVTASRTTVTLTPGPHTLKAWGANAAYRLLDVSDEIEITVH
ncbi:MAG: Ig-like domain-containing protein [Leptospirillia bacterium]